MDRWEREDFLEPIAIVGMAGRFPGAQNVDEFWENLRDGVESISFFTDEELSATGVDLAKLNKHNYVKAASILTDIELFDASFFDFTPYEAEVTDPQHRLFLECAWEALENAGYDSATYQGQIGVYAGVGLNSYLLHNLNIKSETSDFADVYRLLIGNDKDFIATRVSFHLNLTGPSVTVSTACSTSLVAVQMGYQSLLNYQSDMVLVGGVSVHPLRKAGYLYQEGMILSPDGHCRAFDAQAQGTISGDGVGVVVLKRLEDALTDGDCIHALIKGAAVNNNGSSTVGYTAPSVDGQAAVILEAQTLAAINPETITYIEAHGTGTPLGDPIEIASLQQAFSTSTEKRGFCAIGSVKTNVGHLDAAAGIAGLIKTVLALKNQQIPPSLHFQEPNPKIDFANSPFYVNTDLSQWKTNGTPRRAGVSSFGIGGTNAHVVLEEAPTVKPSSHSRPWQVLVLSAKTKSALEAATANLVQHLHSELNLADVAYTLSLGRKAFDHRRIAICQNIEQAKGALHQTESERVWTQSQKLEERSVVFMFSGQGAQYVNMARELYESEPTFAEQVDICCQLLKPHIGCDLRQVLYPNSDPLAKAAEQLQQTAITQPALFVIEYALARLWMEWGVCPTAMIGHSIGEYVAATLAGVFSLEDALALVAVRGKLMQALPPGSMLAVPLAAKDVQPLLDQTLSLAAINGPTACVVSGLTEAIEALEKQFVSQGIGCRRLHTSHAFHSQMMEPVLASFTQRVKQVNLNAPQLQYLSNVSGTWITPEEATDPSYWATHLRQTVHWASGMQVLLQDPTQILLEIGPGRTLTTLAKRHPEKKAEQIVLSSVRHPQETGSDIAVLLKVLGQLWLAGVEVDWAGFYGHEQRHRLPLPTYPFERQRYWIDPQKAGLNEPAQPISLGKKPDIADWFYMPCWKQSVSPTSIQPQELTSQKSCTLVFLDECGVGPQLMEGIQAHKQPAIAVKIGAEFTQLGEGLYALNPCQSDDYDALLNELAARQMLPERIVHLWNITAVRDIDSELSEVEKAQEIGLYSLLFLAQALGKQNQKEVLQLTVISNSLQSVTGEERLSPEKATLLGPVKVIPQEYPNIRCCCIDVVLPIPGSWQQKKLIDQLLAELRQPIAEPLIAYRGHNRWLQTFEPVRLDESSQEKSRLREAGVYLITGGLGGIGLVLAKHLAEAVRAKLVLTGRSALPNRNEWSSWLETHKETDSTSHKIRQVQELEAFGAEVLVISADVTDLAQMKAAIAQADEQFGQLNGVIHAAGVPGGGLIQHKTLEDVQKILAPKVNGTMVLEMLLKTVELDFFVLCSSVSSLTGGLGQSDYCGANAFLDAFACYKTAQDGRSITSINWGAWQEVGMAVNTVVPQLIESLRAENVQQGIAPNEGTSALRRILGTTLSQIVVFPSDFSDFLKQDSAYDEMRILEALATVKQSSSKYPRPELSNDYVAPGNEIEQELVDIWQQILRIELIGIHDNFFELGGDSLIGIQLISRIEQTLKVKVHTNSLFQSPSIAELAQVIAGVGVIESVSQSHTILAKRLSPEPPPLSFAQQRLWFLQQLEPENPSYNEHFAAQLTGLLDLAALEQSLNEIVQRHEALRTTFRIVAGQPVQIIAPNLPLELPVIDLCQLPEAEQKSEVQRVSIAELQRPFDLIQGPLLRCMLLQLSKQEYRLLFTTHHIVVDYWSFGIIVAELSALYRALVNGKVASLPELPIQYADFAIWQRQQLQGEKLKSQLAYWKQQLSNAPPPLKLPTYKPRSPVPTYQRASQSFLLPKHLTEALQAIAQKAEATLFMLLLSTFKVLLFYYSKQADIVVGSPIANRNRVEVERLIGFFINTLALRTNLANDPNFLEIVQKVQKVTIDACDYQDLPFEKLVAELDLERNLESNPLFRVWFVLQNTPMPSLELQGLTVNAPEAKTGGVRYDLKLSLVEVPEGLEGSFEYKTDLFEASTITQMVELFELILTRVVQEPDIKLSKLTAMLEDSRRQKQLEQAKIFQESRRQKLSKLGRRAVSGSAVKDLNRESSQ